MVNPYVPDRGDIAWVSFNPQMDHEQSKRRPALVLSPKAYNEKTGLMICCPVTSKIKGYPFEVKLDEKSVILADQIKNFDWKAREAAFKEKADADIMEEVREMLDVLLF